MQDLFYSFFILLVGLDNSSKIEIINLRILHGSITSYQSNISDQFNICEYNMQNHKKNMPSKQKQKYPSKKPIFM